MFINMAVVDERLDEKHVPLWGHAEQILHDCTHDKPVLNSQNTL